MSAGGKSSPGQVDAAYTALTDDQRSAINSGQAAFNTGIPINLTGTAAPQPVAGAVAPTGLPQANPVTQPGQTFNPAPGTPAAAQPGAFDYAPVVGQMQQYVQSMQKLIESLPR